MKADKRQWRYSNEEPEGRIFEEGDEIPNGWVDSPALLKKKAETPEQDDQEISTEIKELTNLKEEYKAAFGRYPHGRMTVESIRKAVSDSE